MNPEALSSLLLRVLVNAAGEELRQARASMDTPIETRVQGGFWKAERSAPVAWNFYSTGLFLRIEFFRSVCAI